VKLYEEVKDLRPDTVSTGGDPFADARKELESGHPDVDAGLQGMEGRLDRTEGADRPR